MHVVTILLLIAGLVFFLIAAGSPHAGTAVWARTNFLGLGLACWILTVLFTVLRIT